MEAIRLQSPRGQIRFADSREHFEQGVLRLLGIDRDAFMRWLAITEEELGDDLLERLGQAFRRLGTVARPETIATGNVEPGPGGVPGSLWHTAIARARNYGVARTDDGDLGWLVRAVNDRWIRVVDPPVFDQPTQSSLANAANAQGWRAERAQRLLTELRDVAGVRGGRLLEVGALTDHLGFAAAIAGLEHEALDIASAPRMVDEVAARDGAYDTIVLWDSLGRVAEPAALVATAAGRLRAGGVLAVKTPNIRCPEARVFGPRYHSLRREHLVLFTASSLKEHGERAGLRTIRLTSVSHLLVGFLGARHCAELAAQNRGSDLIAFFRKAP